MGPKVAAVLDICRYIGFPEATNALGAITIEMCLSPKSNSAHIAVFDAVNDVKNGNTFKIPSHLINNPTYDDKQPYLYAHDFPGHVVSQQYLPKEMLGKEYYHPQSHTKIEEMFQEQYETIQKRLNQDKNKQTK
jgi:putative ATPase